MSGAKTISGWSHDFLRPLIRRAEDVTKRDGFAKPMERFAAAGPIGYFQFAAT